MGQIWRRRGAERSVCSHLFAGQFSVPRIEASAEQTSAVDEVETKGHEYQTLLIESNEGYN